MEETSLDARLTSLGIAPEYEDAYGRTHRIGPDAAAQLIAAMDVDGDRPAPEDDEAVVVTRPSRRASVPPGELELEDGRRLPVEEGQLPPGLPLGYHTLRRDDGRTTSVIVSPGRCVPQPARIWGWSVQLYSLLSNDSWGIGDLADLRELGRWSRRQGARLLLVNPLDAVVPERPRAASPYFPSSRRFLDPIYLRIEDVPGSASVRDRLPALRADADLRGGRIDRDAVADAKNAALELIWTRVATAGHEEGLARFRDERGPALDHFATFEALAEVHGGGWRTWPARLQDPGSPAVAEFAAAHADRIAFHRWLQWLLDEQLRGAASELGVMRDLPIGVDPGGADAWAWQDLLARDVTVGAPPDELGPSGQDWGLPAFIPWKLRAAGYRPFIETLRAAFRHAGALRIDHVLGLFRLFWVPEGGPTAGAYVQQDAEALLDILALESHRAGAYVVGEDLGTVGPGVRDELLARDMLRYRVFWFEDEPPGRWDQQGLGAVTTHDLPSVGGLWSGAELETHRRLGLEIDERRLERMRRDLARRAGVEPGAPVADACAGAAAMMAEAGCDVVVVQLEDAIGATHRINVPGTDERIRPENWSVPLPCRREALAQHPTVERVVNAMYER